MTDDHTEAGKGPRQDESPGKNNGSKKNIRVAASNLEPPELATIMDSLDRVYAEEAAPPSIGELQALLTAASERQRRSVRREWLLFSLISLLLVGLSLLALASAPPVYWSVQVLVPIVGITAALVRLRRQRHGGRK